MSSEKIQVVKMLDGETNGFEQPPICGVNSASKLTK